MKRKEKNRSTRKVEKSKTAFSKENGSFVLCGFNGFFFYNRKGKSFPLVLYCVIKYAVGFIGFIGAAKILDLYQVSAYAQYSKRT